MWRVFLDHLLSHIVQVGTLRVTFWDGTTKEYGQGAPVLGVTVKEARLPARILRNPNLAVGEAYMDGTFEIENDDLRAFFELMIPNINNAGSAWFQRPLDGARLMARRFRQFAPVGKAQANVAHHYDLSGELYGLFLDADRQYSCAYFAHDGMTLDQAQEAKKHHIARKLLIEPEMRVLDIGCGWGGMALTLARDYGARVVGVTLSKEQHAVAVRRAKEAGLADRVEFRLLDYRQVPESFDRIVSVGMFEHVGVPHYAEYFRFVRDHLTEDGLALIHTIGHVGPPNEADTWMVKYIFPGGYSPALSEMQGAIDRVGLISTDIEVLRLHYARTLGLWHDRFMARVDEARALYDDRFVRMWRYYLLSMEASFAVGKLLVYQVQIGKNLAAAPITRNYLYDSEARTHAKAAE